MQNPSDAPEIRPMKRAHRSALERREIRTGNEKAARRGLSSGPMRGRWGGEIVLGRLTEELQKGVRGIVTQKNLAEEGDSGAPKEKVHVARGGVTGNLGPMRVRGRRRLLLQKKGRKNWFAVR